ncbi:MAG: aminomethyltransferase family protein [Candidatus Poribacteria bacterium]|nr:aminomethyltransferase family protein [Candidatus Poribacteria bacterium]
MKTTPLYETHRAHGAVFKEIHEGWKLVDYYADPLEEHRAVRTGVGIIDFSHRGRVRLTGEDRAKYLHRIISNDVEGLSVGEGNYATILTNRGKLIADMSVYVLEEAITIETNADTTQILAQELDKYLIADDVVIENVTARTGMIGIHGPKSADLLRNAYGLNVDELHEHHTAAHRVEGRWMVCIRQNETGEIGYNLYAASASMEWLWDAALTKGREFGVYPVGLTALNSLRIEAGIRRYGSELTDAIIPLEAELNNALDFEKGCYIGQEIVARMHYRGHPNRLLRGFKIDHDTPPAQGSRIFNGEKEVGWITSAVNSPTLGETVGMGYVRTALTDAGSDVEVETPSGRAKATVVLLPFI